MILKITSLLTNETTEHLTLSVKTAWEKFAANIPEKRYKYRAVVMDGKKVVARFHEPYEGVYINSLDPDPLEEIRQDYDIDSVLFQSLC